MNDRPENQDIQKEPLSNQETTPQDQPTPRPKLDVDSLYPQPTTGILAPSRALDKQDQNTPQSSVEITPVEEHPWIERFITIIGILTILSSAASLISISTSLLSLRAGAASITAGLSATLSIIFIFLGIGLIKREESSRHWYVILSFIGLLLLIPSLAFLLVSQIPQTDTKIDQERAKIAVERSVNNEESRIANYNSRIEQDQKSIAELEKQNDSALKDTIESRKRDIEETKLDIKDSQLQIRQIREGVDKPLLSGLSTQNILSIVPYAVSIINIVMYIILVIFLTRKKVKMAFRY